MGNDNTCIKIEEMNVAEEASNSIQKSKESNQSDANS